MSSAQLETTVAGAVRAGGLELEELDVSAAGRRKLVRVVVDTPDGSPLDLDVVAHVSKAVSAALDAADGDMGSAYTLEVTSRGIDRPLTLPRHWRRARLRAVKARTADGEVTGRIGDTDDSGVTLLVAGELRHVPFSAVEHAVVQIEFNEPPAAEIAALDGAAPADTPAAGRPAAESPQEES